MRNIYLSFFSLIILLSCNSKHTIPEGENYLQVKGGKIWYKVIGKGDRTPIVMLHGGPGFPSYYLKPLFELAKDRQIIVYDQLGSGRSGRLTDTSLMNMEAQLKDLDALMNQLNIKDYYLFAHSYGTMLAVDYYLQQKHIPKAMILASPCMSTKRWSLDADTLIQSMDPILGKALKNFKIGNYRDTAFYGKATNAFYSSFYNKTTNLNLDSAMATSAKQLYQHMWGQEDFMITGNLKNYNRIPDLLKIKVPTLFTCGEFDAARPVTVKYYQSLTPNAQFVLIKNAAHSTMNDNPKANLKAIRDFIHSIEN